MNQRMKEYLERQECKILADLAENLLFTIRSFKDKLPTDFVYATEVFIRKSYDRKDALHHMISRLENEGDNEKNQ